ncbi:MAG: cyclic nucleotide-binding domain-containing protein [Gammaproteobacteria bacterium]|nr:cyclic nucleotide-binding domain-containing protein [Gammaproteobacteria bacterium]
MQIAINFFDDLLEDDLSWFLAGGKENSYSKGECIVEENKPVDTINIVLEGTLGVFVSSLGNTQIASLGLGEVFGEMAFFEDEPASASIICQEPVKLLEFSFNLIRQRIASDQAFGSRFYRALGCMLSRRLRKTTPEISVQLKKQLLLESSDNPVWRSVTACVRNLKNEFQKLNQELISNKSVLSDKNIEQVKFSFAGFVQEIEDKIGDQSGTDTVLKDEISAWLFQEMLPYILLSDTLQRAYTKPRGYAGDFVTLEKIYSQKSNSESELGTILDQCFYNLPPAIAVKNRKDLIKNEILELVKRNSADGKVTKITALASGPAEEIFEAYQQLEDKRMLLTTLIDNDLMALAHVADRRDRLRLKSQIELVNESLIYMALGRSSVKLENQDFIYSMGLIDYFHDKHVIKLLNFSYKALSPGGALMVGNFHTRNHAKAFLDYIIEWKLVHRDEKDMDRIYQASLFKQPCTRILFEQEQVDMFAECVRTD